MSKKPPPFVAGRTYFGPNNERLSIMRIEGDTVHVIRPLSLVQETRTVRQMSAFINGSKLRTYHHKKSGEVRTKIRETADEVTYTTPDFAIGTVEPGEWAKWRKGA